MGDTPLTNGRREATLLYWHLAGFALVFVIAVSSRRLLISADPILFGYLQVTIGLLAFVFAAVALVRFQGTQDRISLILGAGFLLSGTVVSASSVLFFQLGDKPLQVAWAPVVWWMSRMLLAVLLVVALLVNKFVPRSRHPKREIALALFTVIGFTYLITAALRHLPSEASSHPNAFLPSPLQLVP